MQRAAPAPPSPSTGGPYPLRPGNQVELWIDGVPFYERLAAAFRAARRRVWAIVSFIEPTFRFPDGTSWWDLLDSCEARGVDVRVLFWRNPQFSNTRHVFGGGPEDRAFLDARRSRWAARWDSSGDLAGHCHHQKAYVIDGGEDEPIAFVGGMVLSRATLAQPGHRSGYEKHDAFAELHGPVVADAEHNFVQRWNLANTDPQAPPWPSAERAGPLSMPARVPRRRGDVPVQLARTIRRGLYRGPTEVAGAPPFISGDGESTILEHYRAAFAAAQRTIYIENQHPGEASLLQLLADALHRGVQVVMIVPGEPMPAIMAASREVQALAREGRAETHRYGATFGLLGELGTHERFTLAALGRAGPELGTHREIYTHAKLCIVDGAWMTIGSANLVDLSMLADHSELNASIWGEATCLPLLRQLVAEHTDTDTAELNDTELLERIAGSARASRQSLDRGGPLLGGCHAIQSAGYGSNGQTGPRQGS